MERLRLKLWLIVVLSLLSVYGTKSSAEPMGTAFTYQGRLVDANQPANGLYDFQFKLFDGPTGGNQRGPTESFFDIFVDAGYFTVELDFVGDDPNVSTLGLVYRRIWGSGEARWLEIAVRPALQLAESDQTYSLTAGPEPQPDPLHLAYTILSPRQKITPTPYALHSLSSGTEPLGPSPMPTPLGGSGTDNYIPRWLGTSDLEDSVIYQTDAGNVGIGTTNPGEKLTLSGGSIGLEYQQFLKSKGSAGPSYYSLIGIKSANLISIAQTGHNVVITDISPGNVGIGEDRPGSKLSVRGGLSVGDASYSQTSAPTEGMVVKGNVGIGTTSPTAKLQVAGTTLVSNGGIETIFGTASSPGYRFMVSGVNMGIFAAAANELAFSTNSTERMRINSAGNVGIGTTAPTEKLDVSGTARLRGIQTGSGVPVVVDGNGKLFKSGPSSRRYKTNIQDLENDPDKVLELRPVRFQWKTTGQDEIGLIAEEVEAIARDLVIYDQEGKPDAVKYDKVSLYLLGVVKELKSENDSLKQRLDTLEKKIEQIARYGSGIIKEVQR